MTHEIVKRSTYVPAIAPGEQKQTYNILPADIYMPMPPMPPTGIEQIVRHDVTPEARARVLLAKSLAVGGYLSVGTLAAMFVFGQFALFAWLALASIEFLAAFIYIARQDYFESPASQQHKTIDGYLRIIEREQKTRLKAQYGEVIE